LFTLYLDARGQNRELFAHSQEALNSTFGAIKTLVLLSSSLSVVLAVRALRSDRWRRLAPRLSVGAVAVGFCFVVLKGFEYYEKFAAE
jgi:nitric oxide reductase NorE protein